MNDVFSSTQGSIDRKPPVFRVYVYMSPPVEASFSIPLENSSDHPSYASLEKDKDGLMSELMAAIRCLEAWDASRWFTRDGVAVFKEKLVVGCADVP